MIKKYELNDLVTIKNNSSEITIRIFETLNFSNNRVRGIDDSNNEIYELEDPLAFRGKIFWFPCKFRYSKVKNSFVEIEHTENQFTIESDKKSFNNLSNGFNINILKFEEIKLLSLNLYLPLESPNLTTEKILFLINKFIWSVEKTIPVDVYYQNLGCCSKGDQLFTIIKIAVFLPNQLVKKINGNIHYSGIPPKTPLLKLIKDVWLTILNINNVLIKEQFCLSEYQYFLLGISQDHSLTQLTKVVNEISFDFTSEKELLNNLTNKLTKSIKENPKVNLDLIQFKLNFNNEKGDVNKLLNLINKELECDLEVIKIDSNNTIEIAGTKISNSDFKAVLRANDYSNYLFALKEKLALAKSDIAFNSLEVFVATDVLNFTFSKKDEINKNKTILVVNDFISYIINKKLITLNYHNKLISFYYK